MTARKLKPLNPDELHLGNAGQFATSWHVDLRKQYGVVGADRVTARDLLTGPELWSKLDRIKASDLVRIEDADGSDFEVKVVSKTTGGGALVKLWPFPQACSPELLATQAGVHAELDAEQISINRAMLGALA